MGKIIDINERRKRMEAEKTKDGAQTEFDIVEDIREIFRAAAKAKGPSLEVVEDEEEKDEEIPDEVLARIIGAHQSGKFSI